MGKYSDTMGSSVLTERQRLEKRYKSSQISLLLIAAFSGVNLLSLLMNSDKYFLFSAYIPYLLGDYAMFYSGRYPEEYYKEYSDIQFFGTEIFSLLVAVAATVVLFYLVCWFFAKKKKAVWLVFSLVLFSIDTLVMFVVVGFYIDMIIDVIFHIWAIVSLATGISSFIKLKAMPEDEALPVALGEAAIKADACREDSPVLRTADPSSRVKVFVEADYGSLHIVYQRAKRVNELIVNDRVYAEFEVLVEKEHTLNAVVDGHEIEVGYDGKFMTYINADGKQIAKKKRLF